jgi:hypothetical protein
MLVERLREHTGFAVVILALLCASRPSLAQEGPFGPIHVSVNRRQYVGYDCPISIIYSGVITLLPHPHGLAFNYHWERSDGSKTPLHVVRPAPDQRSMVIRETWRLGGHGRQYDASEILFVNSGNTHLQSVSPTVSVVCK